MQSIYNKPANGRNNRHWTRLLISLTLVYLCTAPYVNGYHKALRSPTGQSELSQTAGKSTDKPAPETKPKEAPPEKKSEDVKPSTDHKEDKTPNKSEEPEGDKLKSDEDGDANSDTASQKDKSDEKAEKAKADKNPKNDFTVKESKTSEGFEDLNADRKSVILVLVFITCSFAILMTAVHRVIEYKIEELRDQFIKDAYDTCFKQIAMICLINMSLWLLLQTRVGVTLDSYLLPKDSIAHLNENGTKPFSEHIFEAILCISIYLLAWYIVYILYFQCIVRRLVHWMTKADDANVLAISQEVEFLERSLISPLFCRGAIHKGNYIASRFEFVDNLKTIKSPNIDSSGYYFIEYMRANILKLAVGMFKLPITVLVLILVLIGIFRQLLDYEVEKQVFATIGFFLLTALAIVALYLHVSHIETQLYPQLLSQYLLLKHTMDGIDLNSEEARSILPPYKSTCTEPTQSFRSNLWAAEPMNSHENLFIFKSKGPAVLQGAYEMATFFFVIMLSVWLFLVQRHQDVWLQQYRWANYVIGGCILLVAILLPQVLYSLTIATKTGYLIDVDMVEKVYESRRIENTLHATQLIDGLNMDAVYHSITLGGDTEWMNLQTQLKTAPCGVQKQLQAIWAALDPGDLGYITISKALQFLSSQGIPLVPKQRAKAFVEAFIKTQKKRLYQREFLLLGLVVKNMIVFPLEQEKTRALFENVYNITWTAPNGITLESLQSITKRLGLKWTLGSRRHLLHFLCEGKGDYMSAETFVQQLRCVEQLLKPNSNQGVNLLI